MPRRELLIAAGPGEWRAALVEDGAAVELFVERGEGAETGSIHLGRMVRKLPALAAVLAECGADTKDFAGFLHGDGRHELQRIQQEAEAAGVFGVPSYLLDDGDLFWGREHLPRIRALVADAGR